MANAPLPSEKKFRLSDIKKVQGRKFKCPLCPLTNRVRLSIREHMITYHKITFEVSRKTAYNATRKRQSFLDNRIRNRGRIEQEERPFSSTCDADEDNFSYNDESDSDSAGSNFFNNDSSEDEITPTAPAVSADGNIGNNDFGLYYLNQDLADLQLQQGAPVLPPDNIQVDQVQLDENGRILDLDLDAVVQLVTGEPNNTQNLRDGALVSLSDYISISREDHILACVCLAERFSLSGTALEAVIKLIHLHLPPGTFIETNMSKLKKLLGYKEDSIKKHLICSVCFKKWDEVGDRCPVNNCQGRNSEPIYFSTCPIDVQLGLILSRRGMWSKIMKQKRLEHNDDLHDVYDGSYYQELKKEGGFLHGINNTNLTTLCFTDGLAVYKSSGVGIWGLFMAINEIPKSERFDRVNLLLFGIFQHRHKPNGVSYLKPFQEEAYRQFNVGIPVLINDTEIRVKTLFLLFVQDLPARSLILCQVGHGAADSCCYCTAVGRMIDRGLGRARTFDVQEEGVTARTILTIIEDARNKTNGFYNYSPLLDIPYFTNFSVLVDYMHCVLLNIVGTLFKAWFASDSNCNANIHHFLKKFNRRLISILPPKQIGRPPRDVSHQGHYKAAEWRSILLFYSLPIMKDLLDTDRYMHLGLLVEGTFRLLQDVVTKDDIARSKECYKMFVNTYWRLYAVGDDEAPITLNMHSLLHLPECVERWGSASLWSCFPFESVQGELLKKIHGTGAVMGQMFWYTFAQKKCALRTGTAEGSLKDYLNYLSPGSEYSKGVQVENCSVLGPSTVPTPAQFTRLDAQFPENAHHEFKMYGKVIVENCYMDSTSCTRIKKRNTHWIFIKDRYRNMADVMQVEKYAVNTRDGNCYALGYGYQIKENACYGIAPNCVELLKER